MSEIKKKAKTDKIHVASKHETNYRNYEPFQAMEREREKKDRRN